MNKSHLSDVRAPWLEHLELYLGCSLEAKDRRRPTYLSSPDGQTRVVLRVSKLVKESYYWLGFNTEHRKFLEDESRAKKRFAAFGCGSPETLLLIPIKQLAQHLHELHFDAHRALWYIEIHPEAHGKLVLHGVKGVRIDLTQYLI